VCDERKDEKKTNHLKLPVLPLAIIEAVPHREARSLMLRRTDYWSSSVVWFLDSLGV